MLPGRGGRVNLCPPSPGDSVSAEAGNVLPGRGGRVNRRRRSPGAYARAPGESVSPARGCPLAAWQTVSPSVSPAEAPRPFLPPGDRPRTVGRAGRPG